MKPILFKNTTPDENSFVFQEDQVPYFYDKLHYHAEIQITVILKGDGTRFVGSNVSSFAPGDVYMLGPNLPHVFRCSNKYYEKNKKLKAHGMSVYFMPNSFGNDFFDLPEVKKIKRLIGESAKGIIFSSKIRDKVTQLMFEIKESQGFGKLCSLLNLLRVLSETSDKKLISGVGFHSPLGDQNNKRLNDIYYYLINHFQKEIKLEELSKVANMSSTALCRFFKQRTRKTIFRFLIELRIEHACKMLDEGLYKISDIADACGYNNISNFNRQFLLITGHTPREYASHIGKL